MLNIEFIYTNYYLTMNLNKINKYNLLEKILCRIVKENNTYSEFKKNYNRKIILDRIKKFDDGRSSLSFYLIFAYNDFFSHVPIWRKVDIIIYDIIKKEFKNFLVSNNLLISFNNNIKKYYSKCFFLPSKITNENDLINYFIYRNDSPLNLIMLAFNWSLTEETFEFWNDVNIKYRNFLYNLLLK